MTFTDLAPRSRPIQRIFLSSTGDLTAHRDAVAIAIEKLGHLPVRMETFGARPYPPVAACEQQVRECNALVVIVAHRYGFVPSAEQGGRDGKSMTWIEVEAARSAPQTIEVFAYIVADAEVERDVQGLQRFKEWLKEDAGLVVDSFTSPDDLATKVTADLANWAMERLSQEGRGEVAEAGHALPPASHFHGRSALVDDLCKWWSDPAHPARVCAIVAAGGTGKTATLEQVVRRVHTLEPRGQTLVWSFHDEPHADDFLRAACQLFLGEQDGSAGGRRERLERGLREDNRPHLLVLDGLERLQGETAQETHTLGEIEDLGLRLLLRAIAGGLGQTRALVTSQLPLPDLHPWQSTGYSEVRLEDLEPEAAVAVLRAWEVRGNDRQLRALAQEVGFHALSVSVLGSFLATIGAGDPAFADRLDLRRQAEDEPQATQLACILEGYTQHLPAEERDFLVWLSFFPRGLSIDFLGLVLRSSRRAAGALARSGEADLLHLAHRLEARGLAFVYPRGTERIVTSHAFLRAWFRQLLGDGKEAISFHQAIRKAVAPTLKGYAQPRWGGWGAQKAPFPTDAEVLDRYEILIEHTRLAGKHRKAFYLYWFGLGSVSHLSESLGENARGARILAGFSASGLPEQTAPSLPLHERLLLLNAKALYLRALGQLAAAARHLAVCERWARQIRDRDKLCPILLNLAELALLRGRLPEARDYAREAHAQADDAALYREFLRPMALALRAEILEHLGALAEAQADAEAAGTLDRAASPNVHGLLLGSLGAVRGRTEADLEASRRNDGNREAARCHAVLARVALETNLEETSAHLDAVRTWTARSGDSRLIIEEHWIAADLARRRGDLHGALAEAQAGLDHAEAFGFGLLHIQMLTLLSRIHLAWPDAGTALQHARRALELATAPECSYAWGEADAAHLCGEASLALGEPGPARRCFEQALAVRERIEHPATWETVAALVRLGALPRIRELFNETALVARLLRGHQEGEAFVLLVDSPPTTPNAATRIERARAALAGPCAALPSATDPATLHELLRQATLVVVEHGGRPDDVFLHTLSDFVAGDGDSSEILWTFRDVDADAISIQERAILDGLAPGIARRRVALYGGVDGHRLFTRLVNHLDTAETASAPSAPLSASPFLVGSPVLRDEDFFGRDMERSMLEGALQVGQPVQILGELQTGKTSLLRWAERHARQAGQWSVAWVNAQQLVGPSATELVLAAALSLGRLPEIESLLAGEPGLSETRAAERALLPLLPLVLLVDEDSHLASPGHGFDQVFLDFLHALSQEGKLLWISAGGEDLGTLFRQAGLSPDFLSASKKILLGQLGRAPAKALLARALAPESVNPMLEMAGGFVFGLQLLGDLLWQKRGMDVAAMEAAARLAPIFESWWQRQSAEDRSFLRRAGKGLPVLQLSNPVRRRVRRLAEAGLLAEEDGIFTLPGALWRRFVNETEEKEL